MKFPIIGVTTYQGKNEEGFPIVGLQRAYVDSLVQAGGIPIFIPSCLAADMLPSLLNQMDGILFTGGGDIDVERFGGIPHPSISNVDLERDTLELSILKSIINSGKPFLGICRGFQLINVGFGGTLYTDIQAQKPGALNHDFHVNHPRSYLAHKVEVKSGTILASVLGETDILVNSLHHQGAKDIPGELNQSAWAPDGLIEAVELPNYSFGLAVQWHPEWLKDSPVMKRLFKAFVDASENK